MDTKGRKHFEKGMTRSCCHSISLRILFQMSLYLEEHITKRREIAQNAHTLVVNAARGLAVIYCTPKRVLIFDLEEDEEDEEDEDEEIDSDEE